MARQAFMINSKTGLTVGQKDDRKALDFFPPLV